MQENKLGYLFLINREDTELQKFVDKDFKLYLDAYDAHIKFEKYRQNQLQEKITKSTDLLMIVTENILSTMGISFGIDLSVV